MTIRSQDDYELAYHIREAWGLIRNGASLDEIAQGLDLISSILKELQRRETSANLPAGVVAVRMDNPANLYATLKELLGD
jgi:hypothetical protein